MNSSRLWRDGGYSSEKQFRVFSLICKFIIQNELNMQPIGHQQKTCFVLSINNSNRNEARISKYRQYNLPLERHKLAEVKRWSDAFIKCCESRWVLVVSLTNRLGNLTNNDLSAQELHRKRVLDAEAIGVYIKCCWSALTWRLVPAASKEGRFYIQQRRRAKPFSMKRSESWCWKHTCCYSRGVAHVTSSKTVRQHHL